MTPNPSRRGFLQAAGALIVSFSAERVGQAQFGIAPIAGSPLGGDLDSWIAIGADGMVTAYSGKEELGQGISTAQLQLVAEELCVPLEHVNLIYCDTALTPDQSYTSGSQSHPSNFNHSNLAQACATAREALVRLASQRLNAPVEMLIAKDGAVAVKSDSAKRVNYGELIGGRKFSLALDPKAPRKPASEWTVLGKPVPQRDLPALVTGKFEFVHHVRLPGMLHGRVVRPPVVGANVVSVDEGSVRGIPGLVKVVVKKNFVGVVAQKPWQAIQAARKLKVTWSGSTGLPSHADFFDWVRKQPSRDNLLVDSKDLEAKLASAATVLRATYHYPYQMHGSMGSSCAVADVRNDRATLWSATQGVWYQKTTCALLLGLKPENVRVIFRRGSGCYGLNGADTVTYDAALLSLAAGKPVRVQLTRQEEMAWENYGNSFVIDLRAGLDAQGNIVAWDHEAWSPTYGNRPGSSMPGNVITGLLAGFEPDAFTPRPAAPPRGYNNNSNGMPSYFAGNVNGKRGGTGTVQSERALVHSVKSPFWTGPLRSPARLQNTFAHESFMDELAAQTHADPVEYRLRHLSHVRLSGVVQAAAKAANWERRPSPRRVRAETGVAAGRGIACVAYEGNNGYSALVAEVEVNQQTGEVAVKRFVCAADCGPISNPDGLRNQIEGGALQGMSRALLEEVTWDGEKVTSIDWRTYRTLPLGLDVPKIECVLLNHPEEQATGAGELSITVVAAAIGNAIFDATGARLRQVPFTPERVKAALAARA
ncbi:MAG TPA: molybdopterin cofactor-binding domain-containing protein [Bryobacteraceae bacterium]